MRTGVPVRSILLTAAGNIVVAVWAGTRADGLDILSSAVNVGALTAFILLHVSVIGYFLVKKLAPGRGSWFLHGAVPASGRSCWSWSWRPPRPLPWRWGSPVCAGAGGGRHHAPAAFPARAPPQQPVKTGTTPDGDLWRPGCDGVPARYPKCHERLAVPAGMGEGGTMTVLPTGGGVHALLTACRIVSTDPDERARAAVDRSGYVPGGVPDGIVYAESVDDVVQALRLATRHRVPIVPRGAGAGGRRVLGHGGERGVGCQPDEPDPLD